MTSVIIAKCKLLRAAYLEGKLGNMAMPEDAHPEFSNNEERLVYFTLPMALNYQRNSYTLWQSALAAYNDPETHRIFDIQQSAESPTEKLQQALLKHKVALQPNKHTATRQTIAKTIATNWGTIEGLLKAADYDFLQLQKFIQQTYKSGFPYLSGPKIFHYRSYILGEYGGVELKNKQYIEIAPDTHVIQCSVKLGVLRDDETDLPRDIISAKRRETLKGSGIDPIDMHSPLRFRSRNDFQFKLD